MKTILIGLLILIILILSGCENITANKSVYRILNTTEYHKASFRLDSIDIFEKTFNLQNCSIKPETDKMVIECSAKHPDIRGFSGRLNLRDYEKFYPCEPCGPNTFDCSCSCETDFKKGLAWFVAEPGIMSIGYWFDVNTGEKFCSSGGA